MAERIRGPKDKAPEPRIHKLQAMDVVTGSPEITRPHLTQTHNLQSVGINTAQADDREVRRAVRTSGGGVGAAIAASAGTAAGSGGGRGFGTAYGGNYGGEPMPLQVDDAVSKSTAGEVRLSNHQTAARIRTSRRTAKLTVREQVLIVKKFAPVAAHAVEELAQAIERRQGNDPTYADALQALKELHVALGDLIAQAERGRGVKRLLGIFERKKAKLQSALSKNARLILLDPVAAIAAAQSLEWASALTHVGNVEANATLVGAVYCAIIGGEALSGDKH